MRYKPERTWPTIVRDPARILDLFGPESAPYQKFAQSLLKTAAPILGCDLEYNEPERYVEVPTILGVSDGALHISVPFHDGLPYFKELLQRHPEMRFLGHAFTSADFFAFRQVGLTLKLENIEDTIIRHALVSAHLCKGVKSGEDDEGPSKGKGYMNLWTFLSLYTSLRNYKHCIGEENGCDGSRPCRVHAEYEYNGVDSLGPVWGFPHILKSSIIRGVEKLYPLHRELAYVLGEMARHGVQADREYLYGEGGLQREFERQKAHIEGILPFNPKSNKAAIEHFKKKGIVLEDWQETTIREACEEYDDEELHLSLDHKELGAGVARWYAPVTKDKSGNWKGYMDAYGKIHPRLGMFTSTGRLQCVSPNLQNVSARRMDRHNCECGERIEKHPTLTCAKFKGISVGKLVRRGIIASPGHYLMESDFSNAENRCFLHQSGHSIPLNVDGHTQTSEMMGLTPEMEFVKLTGGGKTRQAAKSATHGCLTGDHEILTPQGWKRIDSCNEQTVLAQWEVEGSKISFVVPEKFHEYDFLGNLIRLKARGLQTLATPNHAWPVNINGSWNNIRYSKTQRKTSDQFTNAGRIAVSGKLMGEDCDISDDDIRRCVAVQADAQANRNRHSEWGGTVTFHVVKERKKSRIRELFGVEGVPCGCHPTGRRFSVNLSKGFSYPLLSSKKSFNEKVLLLSQRQREIFLEEILLWDGYVGKKTVNYSYVNTDYNSLVWAQTVAHLSGRQSLMRETTKYGSGFNSTKRRWLLSFNRRQYAAIETMTKTNEPFGGRVYCFTVPSGYFLTRYRDTIHVTGNSFYLEGIQLKLPREITGKVKKEIDIGAREIWPEWKFNGKIVTFTGSNLAQRAFGDKTYENRIKALEVLKRLFGAYPGAREFQRKIGEMIERQGAYVSPHGYYLTMLGEDEEKMKTAAAMAGSNPIAHLTKLALVDGWREMVKGRPMRPVLQVHDSILWEVRNNVEPKQAAGWANALMSRETMEMPGMVIPTEHKASLVKISNWRDMSPII